MYEVPSLTCSFVYGMGLQPAGGIYKEDNLAGYANHLFFHVRTTTKPKITLVNLCHKGVGRLCLIQSRVFRYQPFASVHNAQLHSLYPKMAAGAIVTEIAIFPLSFHHGNAAVKYGPRVDFMTSRE
jgi:hypothetical protein